MYMYVCNITLVGLGRRVRRVERWALIRCLRLLSVSLWLLHDDSVNILASVFEAELRIDSPPSIMLTKLGSGICPS